MDIIDSPATERSAVITGESGTGREVIATLPVALPPLRERREDIPMLM